MTALIEADLLGDDSDATDRNYGFARYLATKVGGALISLILVILSGFFLFRIIPGDPVGELTHGQAISVAQKQHLRHQLGLDRPWYGQFFSYLKSVLTGDFGTSFKYSKPVSQLITERLWPTILLVGSATILAIIIGLWLGTRAAWKQGSAFDRTHTSIALTLWSMPTFWFGLILLMVFGVGVGPIPGMFPTGGMSSPTAPPGFFHHIWDVFHHLVLPCITLVAVVYAQNLLVMRSSLLDEMGSDYLTTARAKGLRDDVVRRRHAVPNALLPTVTLVFLQLGFVVSGAVTVEVVFSWPGLGSLLYDGISVPDQPLLQGTFIVFSAAVIVMNVLADIVYRFIDPRVRAV
ncbi:MAG TPA: ABC transporter permease [Mycobacteriales bacterium]|nr:ABC transporter permease [Mycobacteriales bacterium]